MADWSDLSRRRFGQGMVATALIGGELPGSALAQSVTVGDWQTLAALSEEARKAGIDVALISVPQSGTPKFSDIIKAIVDFIDDVDEPKITSGPMLPVAEGLKKRAQTLLNAVNGRERSQRQRSEAPAPGFFGGLVGAAQAATVAPEKRYDTYKAGYLELFDTCKIKPEHQSDVDWYVAKMSSAKYRAAYEKLEDDVCVPWYFIAVLHALEASFNFDAHLHNGDPLSKKTTHVPAGRPLQWLPPSDWQSSAKDALTLEGFTNHTDWNLAKTLFRIEAYNGFRSRELHDTNSPYLWSFSNHYTKGKFVADNEWSASAVSQQCGAAVMLKEMLNKKLMSLVI